MVINWPCHDSERDPIAAMMHCTFPRTNGHSVESMLGRMAILLKNVNGKTEAEAFRISNFELQNRWRLVAMSRSTMPRFDQEVVGISYLQSHFSIGTPIPSANNSSCYCVPWRNFKENAQTSYDAGPASLGLPVVSSSDMTDPQIRWG